MRTADNVVVGLLRGITTSGFREDATDVVEPVTFAPRKHRHCTRIVHAVPVQRWMRLRSHAVTPSGVATAAYVRFLENESGIHGAIDYDDCFLHADQE